LTVELRIHEGDVEEIQGPAQAVMEPGVVAKVFEVIGEIKGKGRRERRKGGGAAPPVVEWGIPGFPTDGDLGGVQGFGVEVHHETGRGVLEVLNAEGSVGVAKRDEGFRCGSEILGPDEQVEVFHGPAGRMRVGGLCEGHAL
jgi:hypothetical protein